MARKPACVEEKSVISLVEAEREGWGNYSQLYRLVMNGTIPAFRVGKTIRVKREDLEMFAKDVANDPDATFERLYRLTERHCDSFTDEQRQKLVDVLSGDDE